jgi:hypothetical protein
VVNPTQAREEIQSQRVFTADEIHQWVNFKNLRRLIVSAVDLWGLLIAGDIIKRI